LTGLLLPVGVAWDAAGRLRRVLTRSYRAPVPVVCVGNLVAGGAGKTPVALALSDWLRDRAAGVGAAVAAGASAILLDDGFQNPRIAKTLALIVVDAAYGFGNGRVIPAGPLRENLRGGLARADAVVLLAAEGNAGSDAEWMRIAGGLPVLPAVLEPICGERLAGARLLAFAGIGRPEKFFAT